MIEKLGKVSSVFFGFEDHHILTMSIMLDFGGTGQGFGGYVLDTYSEEKKMRVGTASGTDFVLKILNLFEVKHLDAIVGKPVFALYDTNEYTGKIVGLKTPAFDGARTFFVKEWQREMEA